jgi:hypothetical protein
MAAHLLEKGKWGLKIGIKPLEACDTCNRDLRSYALFKLVARDKSESAISGTMYGQYIAMIIRFIFLLSS